MKQNKRKLDKNKAMALMRVLIASDIPQTGRIEIDIRDFTPQKINVLPMSEIPRYNVITYTK